MVLDRVRNEIAYFDCAGWIDSVKAQQLIEGHFGAASIRLFDRVWVV